MLITAGSLLPELTRILSDQAAIGDWTCLKQATLEGITNCLFVGDRYVKI